MRHVLFVAITFGLVLLVLVSLSGQSETATPVSTARIIEGAATDTTGLICCTFSLDGKTKTCAVPLGQTCDVCASICSSVA